MYGYRKAFQRKSSFCKSVLILSVFRFKYFDVKQDKNPLKVGTDSMLLGAFIDASGKQYALDLGAGTGVLSLMIAQKNPSITIDAIELDKFGAEECEENFKNSPWANNLNSFQGNYFEHPFNKKYDLIFSNPPYHLDSLKSTENNVRTAKHSSEEEVFIFFKLIKKLLTETGHFWMIVPYDNHQQFVSSASNIGLHPNQMITLHSKPDKRNFRCVLCLSTNEVPLKTNEFTIRDKNNGYTKEYRELTKEFHWDKFS